MIVAIDQNICTGCRECAEVCPAYAIVGEQGKPQTIDTDRCVMCGQCVQKCKSYVSVLTHGKDAYERVKKERNIPDSVQEPLFAAHAVCHLNEVKAALADKNRFTIVQCAPAVRVAIAEEFGAELGTLTPGKLSAALHALGFDRVYDTNFPADVTIMEEGTELVKRVTEGGVLPMFTSCCPAWVKFLEDNYPELKDHLSSAKSPQQIGGAIFKTYGAQLEGREGKDIYSVSVMPCTCKEFESERPEMKDSGFRDVDAAITTRDLAWLIKDMGIDWEALDEQEFDQPLGLYTGAGTIFGVTGGVMEAAIRTGYELVTGQPIPDLEVTAVRGTEGFRTSVIKVGDLDLKVGAQPHLVEAATHGGHHIAGVARQVGKFALQLEVLDDGLEGVAQRLACGVVGAVGGPRGGLVVLDVFGADRRPHKDEVVVEMRAVQDLGGDRVEEGLGQLGLVVVDQQADVMQLDLVPHIHGLRAGLELFLQAAHAFLHPQVVELDALALRPLLGMPVGSFKAVLGARGLGAEQPVVAVEAVHHGLGNAIGLGGIQALREHGGRHPYQRNRRMRGQGRPAYCRRVAATPAIAALYSDSRPSVLSTDMCRLLISPSLSP